MSKDKIIGLRVTDEEKKQVERKAKSLKLNVTQFILMLWYRYGKDYK